MKKSISYIILSVCGLLMVIPFIWMLTTSVKSQLEVNKGNVGFLPIEQYSTYEEDGKVISQYLLPRGLSPMISSTTHLFLCTCYPRSTLDPD